jgi:hypothetical protein
MPSRTTAKGLALAATAALALSLVAGGASAAPDKAKQYGKLAAKVCQEERRTLGNEEFRAKYGKPAMPNCLGVVRGEATNAAKECRAEGVLPGNGNAFGKCVSGKVRAAHSQDRAEDRAEQSNAAQDCRTQGVDPGNGNEFGKCVSEIASANANGPKETPPGQE